MIDPKFIDRFVEIVRAGGTVVCNARTREYLMECVGDLSQAVWSDVRFRISPHMKDGHIAAITHDAADAAPFTVTDQ